MSNFYESIFKQLLLPNVVNDHQMRQIGDGEVELEKLPVTLGLPILGYLIAGVAAALLASTPASADELIGSEWRPALIGTLSIPENANIFVQFKIDGKIAGHGGCNRFFGAYETSGNKIKFSPFGSTRMACEKSILDLELEFLTAFEDIATFEKDGFNLALFNSKDQLVIQLVQTDRD